MINISTGVELTFLPNKPGQWKEYSSHEEAKEVAAELNRRLNCGVNRKTGWDFCGVPLRAKADIFRVQSPAIVGGKNQPHTAWLIEVGCNPFGSLGLILNPIAFLRSASPSPTVRVFQSLYDIATKMDLHPCIETVRKNADGSKTLVSSPTGGGHLQVSIDFWSEGWSTLLNLFLLERALCLDFANHPFIRWLFAQWSDDTNSGMAVDKALAKTLARWLKAKDSKGVPRVTNEGIAGIVHDKALLVHSIKQRFAYTGKPLYPTYEFRFFDMPRSVDELRLQVTFLNHWIDHHVSAIDAGTKDENGKRVGWTNAWDKESYTLTPGYLHRLCKHEGFARTECERFFTKIGIPDFTPYVNGFFERNYMTRMRFGQFT